MLSGMFIAASQTLNGAIVLSEDFETGRFNLNDPGTQLDGQWFTKDVPPASPAGTIPNWTFGGSQGVSGTDSYSSPDGVYIPTHTPLGHIAASFFSSSNDGSVNTASIERSVVTDGSHGGIYTIHFWISNPVADPSARQNLFSVTWGTTPLDLTFDTRFKAPNPDPLAFELQGGSNEYVLNSKTNWFEVTISGLTASTSSTVLKFAAQNNNSATLVDDVTVEETPEPSTVALLGAGATFMGMRRRRRAIS